jgi:hypothetical protein
VLGVGGEGWGWSFLTREGGNYDGGAVWPVGLSRRHSDYDDAGSGNGKGDHDSDDDNDDNDPKMQESSITTGIA